MAKGKKDNNNTADVKASADSSNLRDELSTLISKNLSKTFKDQDQTMWYLDGPEESPTDIIDWISTGSSLLDLAISNRPYGGLPVGRISEITGLEGSGKSLLIAHVIAETQKKGGYGVYIDTEASVSREFLAAIGVDLSKMLYVSLGLIEEIFQAIEVIINSARNGDKNRLVTIVVDSLAGATTKQEADADFEKDGYATTKAILLSKAMRKITNLIAKERICLVFTNQLRTKMNTMAFADPWTTSGGKAVAFHSSVRIRLTNSGALKKKDAGGVDTIIGNKIQAKVTKNRIGPPQRKASFEVYYDSGIDNYSGWIAVLKTYKYITGTGAYNKYDLLDDSGNKIEELSFRATELPEIFKNRPEVRDAMYKNLCSIMIMNYVTNGIVRVVADGEEDEDGIKLDTTEDGGAE